MATKNWFIFETLYSSRLGSYQINKPPPLSGLFCFLENSSPSPQAEVTTIVGVHRPSLAAKFKPQLHLSTQKKGITQISDLEDNPHPSGQKTTCVLGKANRIAEHQGIDQSQ